MRVPGELVEARSEARRLLEEARGRAEAIARLAVEAKERACEEGFRRGREEGLSSVTELLLRIRAEHEKERAASAPEIAQIAVRVAEKLLGKRLDEAPETILDLVRTALAQARVNARGSFVLRVHPEDAPCLKREGLSVETDATVGRGGCVVVTAAGEFDARLETQLAALERALTEGLS